MRLILAVATFGNSLTELRVYECVLALLKFSLYAVFKFRQDFFSLFMPKFWWSFCSRRSLSLFTSWWLVFWLESAIWFSISPYSRSVPQLKWIVLDLYLKFAGENNRNFYSLPAIILYSIGSLLYLFILLLFNLYFDVLKKYHDNLFKTKLTLNFAPIIFVRFGLSVLVEKLSLFLF